MQGDHSLSVTALILTAMAMVVPTDWARLGYERFENFLSRTPRSRARLQVTRILLWMCMAAGLGLSSHGSHDGAGDYRVNGGVIFLVVVMSRTLSNVPIWLFAAPAAALAVQALAGRDLLALVVVPYLAYYLVALPSCHLLLIPRGHVRATYFVAKYLGDFLTAERRAAAVVLALKAWRRSPARDAAQLDWLYRCLAAERHVTPTMLVAAGLLQSARGQQAAARTWLRSVFWLKSSLPLFTHLRVAGQWLCAEAAARGAWDEVERSSRPVWWSPTVTFLRGVALWRLQDPVRPALGWLRALSLVVPSQLSSGLKLALEPAEAREADVPPPPLVSDPVGQALALHVHTSQHADVDSLITLGLAWDAAAARITAHGLAIGDEADVQAQWGETVVTELMTLLRGSGTNLSQLGRCTGFLAQARKRLRDQVLRDLEARCTALHERKEAKREAPALEEWEEWMHARVAYDEALALLGRESLPIIWSRWHARMCNYGVWLFNDRRERMLGHHIFRWLLGEATDMQDASSMALQKRNVNATQRWT